MYDFLIKHGQTVSFGLGTAITLIFIVLVVTGVGQFDSAPTVEELTPTAIFDFGLYSSYFLTAMCAIAAIVFPLIYALSNPKSAIVGVSGIVVLLVVFGIAYATSDSETTKAMKEFNVSPSTGQFISGIIKTTTVLAVGAVLAVIVGEIRAFLK